MDGGESYNWEKWRKGSTGRDKRDLRFAISHKIKKLCNRKMVNIAILHHVAQLQKVMLRFPIVSNLCDSFIVQIVWKMYS